MVASPRPFRTATRTSILRPGRRVSTSLLFLGYVGCRPGELCCIRRADRDVAGARVTIRWSLDGQGGEKLPKNGRPRVVTVPPVPLVALPMSRSASAVPTSSTPRPVAGSRKERCVCVRVVRQRGAKRDRLDLYELRHACATLLME